MNKLSLLTFFFGLLLIILGIFLYVFKIFPNGNIGITNTKNDQGVQTVSVEQPKIITCTRTTRLENSAQYDRALSLIQQRVDENNKYWSNDEKYKDNIYTFFPPELVNCIKISEEKVKKTKGIEGYFTFNSKDIKPDYYPITVNSSYRNTDDIVTALLLSHEMTHVQQYIDTLNGKSVPPCIESEIDAFMAQKDFYVILNTEENSSVYYRMQNSKNLHPQLEILDTMLSINRDSDCDFDNECMDAHLRVKLKKMITEDSKYKEQCGLE